MWKNVQKAVKKGKEVASKARGAVKFGKIAKEAATVGLNLAAMGREKGGPIAGMGKMAKDAIVATTSGDMAKTYMRKKELDPLYTLRATGAGLVDPKTRNDFKKSVDKATAQGTQKRVAAKQAKDYGTMLANKFKKFAGK